MASRHLIGNGGPWGTGWGCFGRGLAAPFRLGFRTIEDIKWILPALAATRLRPGQLKGRGHNMHFTNDWSGLGVIFPTSRPRTLMVPLILGEWMGGAKMGDVIYVTVYGKTGHTGFFVKIEFDASMISSTIELTRVQVLDRSRTLLWRYSALFAITPHPR